VFNLGVRKLIQSTLLKKLNAGDYVGAANEFDKWVFAAGKKLKGLVARRAAEKELFLKGE
jgi:lysozyme